MSEGAPWPYPRVLAHRGGGALAPENTIAAIKVGYEYGFRAIEFDAMLAADNVPVLIHDPTLERTGRVVGAVSQLQSGQLERVDVGGWHSLRFAGETIPTLQRTLHFCRDHQIWPNIEIKPAPGFEAETGSAVARITEHVYQELIRPDGDRAETVEPRVPLLSSFAPAALIAARGTSPWLPRGWLVDRVPPTWRDEQARLGCVSLHTNHEYLTASMAGEITRGGTWLFCYTVNEPDQARKVLGWGVDALCTDAIDRIGPDFAGSFARRANR